MKKVTLIPLHIFPSIKPYIRENDFYIDKATGQYFRCECDHNNKKILSDFQPIRFSMIDEEGLEVLSHEQIIKSSINYAMLDELIDEVGLISTKHVLTTFDVELCELIIIADDGVCWIEQKGDGHVIHLQDTKPITRKQLFSKG